ncbi:hypothetical protein [Kutzneria sp. NPDC051319]|uniref:hypothetical protein n=1 Tax=Kutzneria sp. NPDC051319 TaxID=3155047 RepID=UPI0034179C5A
MLRTKFRMIVPAVLAAATVALTMAQPAQAAGADPGDMQLITSSGTDLSHTIRNFWGNWTPFGTLRGYSDVHELTSTYHFGEEHAFFMHDNNQLAHLIRHSDGTWDTVASTPALPTWTAQLTSTDVDGHLTLIAEGQSGAVQMTSETDEDTWTAWSNVPTDGHPVVDIAAVAEGGTLKVVELDQDHRHMGEFERSSNGTWTSDGWTWIAPDSGMYAMEIAAAQVGSTLQVAAVETDWQSNAVYHTTRPDNGPWQTLPGNFTGTIYRTASDAPWHVAIAPWEGALQMAYSTNNGDLMHTIRRSDATWQTPGRVQSTAGNVTAGSVTMATNSVD